MTSQPQPAPGEGKSAGQFLRPLRDLAAYALVGATAVLLLVALIRLIPSSTQGYSFRTQDAFYGFVNTQTVFFPLGAVLLALLVQPRHPKAQLIVMAAVVEYAVAAFFGVVFGLLIGVINHASNDGARTAFEELLVRLAWLGLLAVAGYAAFQVWRGMYYVPRPKPQPGVYGQPPQFNPAAYPGQPGFGPGQPPHPGFAPHPGQSHPGQPHPGQPHPGQPHPGQPGFPPPPAGQPGFPPPPAGQQGFPPPPAGQPGFPPPPPGQPGYPPQYPAPQSAPPAYGPGVYGQPQQPPAWNQPPVTMPATTQPTTTQPTIQPTSAPPAVIQPTSAPPAVTQPTSAPPSLFTEPTQVVPSADVEAASDQDAEVSWRDRPGFGPAEPDPPRH